jgi:hypothetical protein
LKRKLPEDFTIILPSHSTHPQKSHSHRRRGNILLVRLLRGGEGGGVFIFSYGPACLSPQVRRQTSTEQSTIRYGGLLFDAHSKRQYDVYLSSLSFNVLAGCCVTETFATVLFLARHSRICACRDIAGRRAYLYVKVACLPVDDEYAV